MSYCSSKVGLKALYSIAKKFCHFEYKKNSKFFILKFTENGGCERFFVVHISTASIVSPFSSLLLLLVTQHYLEQISIDHNISMFFFALYTALLSFVLSIANRITQHCRKVQLVLPPLGFLAFGNRSTLMDFRTFHCIV